MQLIVQYKGAWLAFREPVAVITAVCLNEVDAALARVDEAVADGLYAAGFVTYEAGAAWGLTTHDKGALPLLAFGLYEQAEPIDLATVAAGAYALGAWQAGLTAEVYVGAIERIKAEIAAGNSYQINYTFPLQTTFAGDSLALFCELAQAQRGCYMAYVSYEDYAFCSVSPELFFQLDGDVLTARPMKGTAVRGLTLAQDEANMAALRESDKNQAENVMIVDMIRNDLGRIAEVGTVKVPQLLAVERYPTVLQMTSTVTAVSQASLSQILANLFPCASITGAPKVSTMSIIEALEPQARGIYTGTIGFMTPQRQAQFNVAIRTVAIDYAAGTATYGVGSGIVWDSVAEAEYEECLLKAEVLKRQRPDFALLESLLWTPTDGYFLLAEHMQRLLDSALYFGVDVGETAVVAALDSLATTLTEAVKVRLLVGLDGAISVEVGSLATHALPEPIQLGWAREPVQQDSVWLYHKTTQRGVYKAARASRPDCDEVLLWNEAGALTEASSSNVAVLLEGALLTSPVEVGLLGGTLREAAMRDAVRYGNPHGLPLQVARLTKGDVARADEVWLLNSVRGWRLGELVVNEGRDG